MELERMLLFRTLHVCFRMCLCFIFCKAGALGFMAMMCRDSVVAKPYESIVSNIRILNCFS